MVKKKEREIMLKRIGAIIILVGFILLIFNILITHFYIKESLIIYAIIALLFILKTVMDKKEK